MKLIKSKFGLITACLILFGVSNVFARMPTAVTQDFEIEGRQLQGNLVIPIKINQKGPFYFYFDTGASGSLHIKPQAAKDAELAIVKEGSIADMMGNKVKVPEYDNAVVTLGTSSFQANDILGFSHTDMLPGWISGVLGRDIFTSGTLSLDFNNYSMKWSAEETLPIKRSIAYTVEHGHITIPLSYGQFHFKAHFDSGNSASAIALPRELSDKLEFDQLPMKSKVAKTATTSIQIDLVEPPDAFSIHGVALNLGSVLIPALGPIANIGAKAVTGHQVKIDFSQQRFQFILYNDTQHQA